MSRSRTGTLVELLLGLAVAAGPGWSQSWKLEPVEPVTLPTLVDSNTASFWRDGQFHIFSSSGHPILTWGDGPLELKESVAVQLPEGMPEPLWIEAVWQDPDGTLFLWYHHEVVGICGDIKLTTPKIGAAVSYDGGRSIQDLGMVLVDGNEPDCGAANGFFAGGHGDFSVIHHPADDHFYFYFSAYGGDVSEQGVAVARMAASQRWTPVGNVWKYRDGIWNEPGVGGRVSPVFAAQAAWQRPDADSFWGPSVHWNTFLQRYVVLMNRACCQPGWPQEGIYVSFNPDLSHPAGWKVPVQLFPAGEWYPQVIGLGPDETDRLAGQTPRLFIRGFSDWQIVFDHEAAAPASSEAEALKSGTGRSNTPPWPPAGGGEFRRSRSFR